MGKGELLLMPYLLPSAYSTVPTLVCKKHCEMKSFSWAHRCLRWYRIYEEGGSEYCTDNYQFTPHWEELYNPLFRKIIALLYKFKFHIIWETTNCLKRGVTAGTFKTVHFKYERGFKKSKSYIIFQEHVSYIQGGIPSYRDLPYSLLYYPQWTIHE